MYAGWHSGAEGSEEEQAVVFAASRRRCVLVVPALFDEGHKLRRLTLDTMRMLDASGVDCVLPDIPGLNESLATLAEQTLESWRNALTEAGRYFGANECLAIRGGALIVPEDLPTTLYAPVNGAKILRGMIRARTLAAREAGRNETADALLAAGLEEGLELAGYRLGAQLLRDLQLARASSSNVLQTIEQSDLDGPGLWLRAEPSADTAQAQRLADLVAGTAP